MLKRFWGLFVSTLWMTFGSTVRTNPSALPGILTGYGAHGGEQQKDGGWGYNLLNILGCNSESRQRRNKDLMLHSSMLRERGKKYQWRYSRRHKLIDQGCSISLYRPSCPDRRNLVVENWVIMMYASIWCGGCSGSCILGEIEDWWNSHS